MAIDFKTPIQKIKLLSGAKLYKNIPEEIEVENMVTEDEDLLYSNMKVESGDTFKRLVQNKIKTPGVYVNDLLIGDFNQLLIHIRSTGYGEDYEINTYDSDLQDYIPKTINLNELKKKELGGDYNENGEYTLTLPVSKHKVTFKLATVGLGDLINAEAEKNAHPLTGIKPYITTKLKYLITSVEDSSDPLLIHDYVKKMSPRDRLAISKKIEEVEPDVILKWKFTTSITKQEYETDIMLGMDFFFPQD